MNKKIYIITEGEYSDYHITGVAEDRETAELLIKNWGRGQYIIEEYYINSLDDAKTIQNKTKFEVTMWKNGNSNVMKSNYQEGGFLQDPRFFFWGGMQTGGIEVVMELEVWANSKEHAVKIANEKRSRLIASGEWDLKVEELNKEQEEWYKYEREHAGYYHKFLKKEEGVDCTHTNYMTGRQELYSAEVYKGDKKYLVYTCRYCHKVIEEVLIE